MEIQVLLVVYVTLFFGSPLIALLHETGHAVAYLVLTKPKSIDIFVGSYGDQEYSTKIEIGRLTYYVKRAFPFVRSIGLCKSSDQETKYSNYIIILLAGPVLTFLIAVIIACIVFVLGGDHNFYTSTVCYIFLGLSGLSLIGNLIPREITTSNRKLSSDGKQILFTLKIRKGFGDYIHGNQFLIEKDYEQAIIKYQEVLKIYPREKPVLGMLINALMFAEQFNDAKIYLDRLEAIAELSTQDIISKGYIQALNGLHHEAIGTFNTVLKRDRNNIIALNNIGNSLIEQKAFDTATRVLERAIRLKPNFAYPYANLAHAKLLQGDLQEGKKLLDKAFELMPEDADNYKFLGIYYLKTKDITLAEINFNKAIELDKKVIVNQYLEELEKLKAEVII